ncbi:MULTISPECIES: helicase HerA-like domain-containing protein [unclassified Streptomyces]|uniref:helicase HerA-like domain-containing protein n=1 Tax=unclassified Streptomyces TaxID=2593676 RepID=UPI003867438E
MSDSESAAESAGGLPEPTREIAAGYAVSGDALDLGALLWDGTCLPDAQILIPLAMLNRHGLVAGATGTGKTKTLQLIAEQLSAGGVPVFLADIKGDVSGIAAPGAPGDRVTERAGQWGRCGRPRAFRASSTRSAASAPASRCARRSPASAPYSCPRRWSSTRRRSSRSA